MSEIKRVRYFNGEFLFAEDFNADHEYHRSMRYRHNKHFHTLGIVTGLVVTYTAGETSVTITPGLAVDKDGREIVFSAGVHIDFNSDDYMAENDYYISVSWSQQESDLDENGNAKRWDETPVIKVSIDPPEDSDLEMILGKVQLNDVKVVVTVDETMRKVSAMDLGDNAITSSKIAAADGTTAQDTGIGSGVKTAHIQDGAVTESKLDTGVFSRLVTGGDKHDHTAGNGAQISHSSLLLDGGANPHGTAMSQLTDYNANGNRIINLPAPVYGGDAVNKTYVDALQGGGSSSGGSISSMEEINEETTEHNRKISVSEFSSAIADRSQVNASEFSLTAHFNSQVMSSRAVSTGQDYSVCGGYSEDDVPSDLNRKWELDSMNGNINYMGAINTKFSDYGEYFENLRKGEIDTGVLIALEGAKVRPAKKNEDFIGVVSGTAAVRLGDTPFYWQGRFIYDEWGKPVTEKIRDPRWKPGKNQTEKDRPELTIYKENRDFDPSKTQIPRSQRPKEWTLVGLLGQVYVRCDDTVQPGDYIQSAARGLGTRAKEKTQLRAMKITRPLDGTFAIVFCLLR